VAGIFCIF